MGCVGVAPLVELIYSVHCMPDSVAKHVYKSLPANLHIASANEEEQERASKSSAEGKLLATSDWRWWTTRDSARSLGGGGRILCEILNHTLIFSFKELHIQK